MCVVGLTCLAFADAFAADKIAGTLSVQDALTMPGRPVMLEATLVQDSLLRQIGIGGELIEFQVAGKKVGTAMTGGDGRARLEYTPHMRGNLSVTARQTESRRVQSSDALATLFAWERRRPILLVEFAALVESPKAPVLPILSLPVPSPSLVPLPNAAEELKRLTEYFFNVTYVSRGESQGIKGEDTRDWLRQQGFPPGLVVSIKPGKEALVAMIDDVRAQGWDNLKSGVGRTKEFAQVLVEHRMDVVMVPEPDRGEAPKKAKIAKGWKDARKKLQG